MGQLAWTIHFPWFLDCGQSIAGPVDGGTNWTVMECILHPSLIYIMALVKPMIEQIQMIHLPFWPLFTLKQQLSQTELKLLYMEIPCTVGARALNPKFEVGRFVWKNNFNLWQAKVSTFNLTRSIQGFEEEIKEFIDDGY